MSVLICGSLAYDTIMRFDGRFKENILPDATDHLNVSFLTAHMRREFGGCAGNIAYNLSLLGVTGYPMATVGRDFQDYATWMDGKGVSRSRVKELEGMFTSQAFISTDLDDNQITLFHPGAMDFCHEQEVDSTDVRLGLISPEGRTGMIQHAEQMAEAGIPFLFDPGQGMPMFQKEDFLRFVEQATWAAFNGFEAEMMQKKSELTIEQLAERLEAVIVTHSERGSCIYRKGQPMLEIPVVPVAEDVDPTGCGDAYRAGLLYGVLNDMDWETCGRLGSLMGACKVQHQGAQNHTLTLEEITESFREEFGYSPE